MKTRNIILTTFIFLIWPSFAEASELNFVKQAYESMAAQSPQIGSAPQWSMNDVERLFDIKGLFERVTQDFSNKLTPSQANKLKYLYEELMARNIMKNAPRIYGKALENRSYILKEKKMNETVITVLGKHEDMNVDINFTVIPYQSTWKIVDLEIKGALLSRQYRGQFNRIFRKEGFEGLKNRMQIKLAEL